MKKKLDDLTKCKLIYSGELLGFGVIFIVIGFLFLFDVIHVADWKRWAFTILTLVGGVWVWIDFFWTLNSEKRRKKNSMVDKMIVLPNATALVVLDTIALIHLIQDPNWTGFDGVNFFRYVIGGVIIYLSLVFIFEAIYHWFVLHPMIDEMMEEEKQKELEEAKEKEAEKASALPENKEEDKKEDSD